jgi:hypothetical protein
MKLHVTNQDDYDFLLSDLEGSAENARDDEDDDTALILESAYAALAAAKFEVPGSISFDLSKAEKDEVLFSLENCVERMGEGFGVSILD